MPQSSYTLLTQTGAAKEAAALAGGTPLVITHIAIGQGQTVPSGAETRLYDEITRKTIAGSGVVVGALNTAWFDCHLAVGDGPWLIREAGLIDADGDLIAFARYDPPINKPLPESGQVVEGTLRLQVAFSATGHLDIVIDPTIRVVLQRLSVTPWIPVISASITAPPADAEPGDTYLVPADATGAWAGQTGNVAEYTAAGWAIVSPRDGQACILPSGVVLIRRGGEYSEFAATETTRGLTRLATPAEAQAGTDPHSVVTPEGLGAATLAILSNNRAFPHVLTEDNRLAVSDNGDGTVTLAEGQSFLHRGFFARSTDDLGGGARTLAIPAGALGHLRWRWTGPSTAPQLVFASLSDAAYNPGGLDEGDPAFDTTYDDMLIARIQRVGSGAPQITLLRNAAELLDEITDNAAMDAPNTNGSSREMSLVFDWSRRPSMVLPIVTSVTVANAIFGPNDSHDHDAALIVQSLDRYAASIRHMRDYAIGSQVRTTLSA